MIPCFPRHARRIRLEWRTVRSIVKRILVTCAATTALALLLTMVLCALGNAMAPKWQVEPFTDHITLTTTNTAIQAVDPATGAVLKTPQEGAYRTKETHITVALDGGKNRECHRSRAARRAGRSSRMPVPARFGHRQIVGGVRRRGERDGVGRHHHSRAGQTARQLHHAAPRLRVQRARLCKIAGNPEKMAGREQIGNRHLRRIGRHMDRHRADATASGSCLRHPHLSPGRFGPSADDARSHQLSDRRGRTRCRQAAYSAHHQPWHTTHGTRLLRISTRPNTADRSPCRYSSTMASRTQPCRSNRARGC